MSFTALLIASYGVCFGLMNEKLAALNKALYRLPLLRKDGKNIFERLFQCAYCTGFHTGWLVWGFAWVVCGRDSSHWEGLVFAFASGASCYFLDTALRWLETQEG